MTNIRNNDLFFLILISAYVLLKSDLVHAKCESIKKCHECIQMLGCKWCYEKPGGNNAARCVRNETTDTACQDREENPKSTSFSSETTDSASPGFNPTKGFSPTNAKVQLRKGDKVNITVKFKDDSNRPLDLYILVDRSSTMTKYISEIERLTDGLVNNLNKLTNSLQLGFGSFVDKPISPYAKIDSGSDGSSKNKQIRATYSFKNDFPLSENHTAFKFALNNSKASTNIDAPEGGLDALMQVIVCSEIGWRKDTAAVKTRRMVVFSTDEIFHLAGDGKLGGILIPNDEKCHLEKGEYTHSTETDYPSISQIKDKLIQNDIYVIFAVTKSSKPIYEMLAGQLEPLSVAKEITDSSTSGSIVEIIKEEYQKLVGMVNLQTRKSSASFSVNYYAQCKKDAKLEKRSNCTDLKPGANMKFIVEVELSECTKNTIATETLEIGPSLGDSVLKIEVEKFCGCECEKTNNDSGTVETSAVCQNKGFLQCGICKCDENWGGGKCECSRSGGSTRSLLDDSCRKTDDQDLCSGRGTCDCGVCKCIKNDHESFSGTHCECDDNGCERNIEYDQYGVCNNKLGQGKCECNRKCNCTAGYEGSRCQCPTQDKLSEDARCKDPNDKKSVCNGHGKCECLDDGNVKCKCNTGFLGNVCEIQTAKGSTGCEPSLKKWQPCIKCLTEENVVKDDTRSLVCFNSGKCDKMQRFRYLELITKSSTQPKVENFDFDDGKDCLGKVEDGDCWLNFIISNKNKHDGTTIFTEKKLKCPASAPMFTIIGSVIGFILLIGILTLLIWKILTHIHDKKEFQRFENERNMASWGMDNDLYVPVVSEFRNPAYSEQ